PQFFGGDLCEGGARALPHLSGANEHDYTAVRFQAANGARDGVRPRREQANRDAATHERLLWLVPADSGGHLRDVAGEIGVERLAAGADLLPRREQVLATQLERVE